MSDTTVVFDEYYPEGLLTKTITITGTVNANPDRFAVNLYVGPDIALHFNPRFKEAKIVVNSFIDGAWGTEMIEGSFPFAAGQSFVLYIEVYETYFKVRVPGSELLTFNQRLKYVEQKVENPEAIKRLQIKGDVTVSNVNLHKL